MTTSTEKKRFQLIDEKFKENPRKYVFQCLLAGSYLLLIFYTLDVFRQGWTIAPLGASTFIAFAFPHADSSRPRYLVGGYSLAVATGCICSWLAGNLVDTIFHAHVIYCGLVMLITMFGMVSLDMEHPPAAALAVTLVLADDPLPIGVAAVLCICVLSLIKHILKPWLKNL